MPDVADDSAPKDTRFDPSRIPVSDAAKAIVADVRGQLLNYEKYYGLRQRARRLIDQSRFDRMVSAIVCDLMHAAMIEPKTWRHISLSKRHHGAEGLGAPFMTADRIKIIQWMATPDMDWLELEKGQHVPYFGGRQSRIRASARLLSRMDDHNIQYEDIGRDPALLGDPLVLRSPKVRGKAKLMEVPAGEPAHTFRAEVLRINAWLAGIAISCDFDSDGCPRDVGDRWLRRIFNDGRMDQGGRLYGGFWQAMKSEDRLTDLEIDREKVAALDFGQCAVRIAYGLAGAQPPSGDLYSSPGLAGTREGVKRVLNAMLARQGGMARKPAGSAKYFGRDVSVGEIEEAILSHHRPIRELCYTGMGLTLQYIESLVLVRTLLDLAKKKLSALPIHDCLVVPVSVAEQVKKAMLHSFREATGVEGMVTIHADT